MRNDLGQPIGDAVPGWEAREPAGTTRLEGTHVRIVPLDSVHYADLYAATCGPGDDALWTYRTVDRPGNLAALWMHLAGVQEADPTFAIVPLAGERAGKAAGIASYLRIDPRHGQVELGGILLARSLQRTTAATEAMRLFLGHAFDDLGYRRFEWKCDSLNEPSRQAALRLGFTEEGRFRNHMVYKGRNRDTDWFSMLDSEWPGMRERLDRWLDPANFDAAGRQRRSLQDG